MAGGDGTGHFDQEDVVQACGPSPEVLLELWLKSPVPFLQETGGGKSGGGGGSYEVCGFSCETHTTASPDTCYEGASEPPLATSPLPVSFSALPKSPLACPQHLSLLRAQSTKEVQTAHLRDIKGHSTIRAPESKTS